jgi:hypothetical protein
MKAASAVRFLTQGLMILVSKGMAALIKMDDVHAPSE